MRGSPSVTARREGPRRRPWWHRTRARPRPRRGRPRTPGTARRGPRQGGTAQVPLGVRLAPLGVLRRHEGVGHRHPGRDHAIDGEVPRGRSSRARSGPPASSRRRTKAAAPGTSTMPSVESISAAIIVATIACWSSGDSCGRKRCTVSIVCRRARSRGSRPGRVRAGRRTSSTRPRPPWSSRRASRPCRTGPRTPRRRSHRRP